MPKAEPRLSKTETEHFRQGIALFNRGTFWESHESWEAVWRGTDAPWRLFFQGLIQMAAGYHQLRRGIRHGVLRHLQHASDKLESFPEDFLGIDVSALQSKMAETRAAVESCTAPDLAPLRREPAPTITFCRERELMASPLIDSLCIRNDARIVFLILDGLGGLQLPGEKQTELGAASTPNMDKLVAENTCGLMTPVEHGITPGSGPGHFGLFGYDPVESNIGRGVLSASGLEFELTERDVAARVNLATIDGDGNVTDRRAGRIETEENERICQRLRDHISLPDGIEFFLVTEKQHRALLVVRGDDLGGDIADTDPQKTGVPPKDPEPLAPDSGKTAEILTDFLAQTRKILADEPQANMLTLRGVAKHRRYPSLHDRFNLDAYAIANYPMYRGIARLVGMEIAPVSRDFSTQIDELERTIGQYTFFFMHMKKTDAMGEDGNFAGKVAAIEEVDALLPRITALEPDVLVITGDHSTPSAMGAHSWHPIPVALAAGLARRDAATVFNETECLKGGLGTFETQYLMNFALAHAGKLAKFGA